MKPVIFSLLAVIGYALSNTLLELKFSKFNPLTLMICYLSVILAVAIIARQVTVTDAPSFNFPSGSYLIWVVILGLIMAVADYFYVGSYTAGGSLMTITSMMIMFPVFASIVKFAVTRELPNVWQVGGYFFAVIAVILITKGSLVK
jgi:drug/metabolite transporter (DMT)-like permease